MALLSEGVLGDIRKDMCYIYVRALWEECREHHCPRCTKLFPTEVRFCHGGVHGDSPAAQGVSAKDESR
jgi:hypothetical protein